MRDPKSVALVGLGLLCSFLAGGVLFRAGPAEAQQTSPIGSGGGAASNNRFLAATGTVGSGMSVLWLVDSETKRVLVFGSNSLGKNIELRAARDFEWDLRLEELNDDSQYKVEDMKRLVERARQQQASGEKASSPPAPPQPPSGK
jgi:hypothetical protein